MTTPVIGIQHVSAIATDPQRNVDFYAGVLGLRLVKRTVNFDDPQTYHLYYGDAEGTPGSLLTFFPWPGARRGQQGSGQVAVTSLAALPSALAFWVERLVRHAIPFEGPSRRGRGGDSERVLAFRDPDGLMLEIVGHSSAEERHGWDGTAGIAAEQALRGLHAVTLWADRSEETAAVLVDTLGFRQQGERDGTSRFATGDGGPGTLVELRTVGGFLHGTGGDENDLVPLGRTLLPGAGLLSPRGNVLEYGAPRFFRRLAEGVLDQPDLERRTHELATFVLGATACYALRRDGVIAVGFSNGANIAISLLVRHPGLLHGAVLLSPMLPYEPTSL